MAKCKSYISLIIILSFIGFIPETFAQRSYRREFPASVSPKPEIIQERESREEMKREYGEEKAREKELLELKQEELLETRKAELKAEGLIKEGDRLYKEGKYEEAAELYDEAYRLAKEEPKLVSPEPIRIYYQISIGDKLYIGVWRVPDLSMEFIVGPDGYISFPLIGDIRAYGKTLSELDAEVTEALKEYVNDPQVSVMVREFAGDNVTVLGEVAAPGIYKFVRRTNLIDVIALAHGFTDRAKVVSVAIVREPEDPYQDPELIVVNAKNILKGKLRKVEVEPNDIVYVSRTFISNFKEFWDNWLVPLIGTATDMVLDYETFMALRKARRHGE